MNAKAIDASHPGLKPALDAGLQPRAAEQLLAFYDEPHRYYHNRVQIRTDPPTIFASRLRNPRNRVAARRSIASL
jgi:hypothetical protein